MQMSELVHEMRNALTVARANLEAIIDGKLAPTPQRLDAVLQALTQLESVVEDLRVFGPTVEAQERLHQINVCDLLQREYVAIEAAAKLKNITVTVQRCAVPAAECKHFYADPTRIGQIIKNILLNGIRYTPAGGSLQIDCSRRADQLEIQISDTGPGLTADEREAIFASGVRGSAGQAQPGSGYGLALVRRYVEEHGGQVMAQSEESGGARFTVRLPGTIELAGPNCSQCAAGQPSEDRTVSTS